MIIKTDQKHGFQSTPPYGGDLTKPEYLMSLPISIHASIRRRQSLRKSTSCQWTFQSTPPYGGDFRKYRMVGMIRNFNPRLHTEATSRLSRYLIQFQFQSTPPYGGDTAISDELHIPMISIHASIRRRRHADLQAS